DGPPQTEPADDPPPAGADDLQELAKPASPLDGRKREDIRPDLLALAGRGDPGQAPDGLVAVLGDGRFALPGAKWTPWRAVSPAGHFLAVPRGNAVVLFDAHTGVPLRTLKGFNSRAYATAFSPDSKYLAAGSLGKDNLVSIWEVPSGREVLAVYPGIA